MAMADPRMEDMHVSFPASGAFAPIGRVAASGLALRLGFDVSLVEELRLAVDIAVEQLSRAGHGTITLASRWNDVALELTIANSDAELDQSSISALTEALARHVEEPTVSATSVTLRLGDA